MNYYIHVLKNYAQFSGRARRSEFWYFVLFSFIVSLVLSVVDAAVLGGSGMISGLYSLGVLIPSLAVGARRLHDTGRSGWMQLIGLIPLVGIIVLIVFWAQEGAQGDNRFGPDPKAA